MSIFMYPYPYFQGLLLGWAWGNAAMVAALHSRSPALLAHQTQQFQSSYVFLPVSFAFVVLSNLSRLKPNVSVDLQAQIAVLHGLYLDPRSPAPANLSSANILILFFV